MKNGNSLRMTPDQIEAHQKWKDAARLVQPSGRKVALGSAGESKRGPAQERACTCHPEDNPPVPCQRKYALTSCLAAAAAQDRAGAIPAAAAGGLAGTGSGGRKRAPGRAPSPGEALFAVQLRASKLTGWGTEFYFARPRRWRFDFAWPVPKLALEIEGGAFTGGRHTRGAGFEDDCEKYNAALVLGWRVLRVTPAQVKSGAALAWAQEILR